MRTAADETDTYRLTPRLAYFQTTGDQVQPGDSVYLHRDQAAHRVGAMWCGKIPGGTAWNRRYIHFRDSSFPFAQHQLMDTLTYTVQRTGVYVEGWSPEDCERRRRELEAATA